MRHALFAIFYFVMASSAAAQIADPPEPDAESGSPIYDVPGVSKDVPLEGDALEALFNDRLHRGYYDYLRKPDGEYSFSEMMNADGTTLHERDGVKSAGRWRAMSNVVCFTYDDLGGGCFNLYQRGNCYYAYSVSTRDFVAVTVMDDEKPNCEPPIA